MNEKKELVPRITQLDAKEFDREVYRVLSNEFSEICNYLKPGALNNYRAEINLAMRLIIYNYSLLKCNSSFGQQLLNLQYDKPLSTLKKILFSMFNHFFPYIKEKEELKFLSTGESNKHIEYCEMYIKLLQSLNLLLFLQNGIYSDLVDRLLKLKVIPVNRLNRNVGYSYMMRELLWHGFMEFFMYALPLINYKLIKRKVKELFTSNSNVKKQEVQVVTAKLNMNCCICEEMAYYPCRVSNYCKHVACYYCIKTNVINDQNFACPFCGVQSTAFSNLQHLTG